MGKYDTQRLKTQYNRLFSRINALAEASNVRKIPMYAAYACYFMVLAVFPMLLLVLSVLRYTTLRLEDLIVVLDALVPGALRPAVERLIVSTYESASTAIVSVSALAALWSASRSVYGLALGLNAVYGVKENRGYLYTRAISVLYMFLFLVVLVLTLVIHVFGQTILRYLPAPSHPIIGFFTDVVNSRYLLLLLVQTALFTAMYSALPNRRNPPGDCFPGAVLASVGWQVISAGFSLYVDNFNHYANIYGSLYTVALGMLWLYCCIFIIFLGGAVNRLLALWRQRKK